jgi:hypothetical protein
MSSRLGLDAEKRCLHVLNERALRVDAAIDDHAAVISA